MPGEVRILRFVSEGGAFKAKRDGRLTDFEARQVAHVVRELRKAQRLPGDDDYPDTIACGPACFRRHVPDTDLWIYYYEMYNGGGAIHVATVNSPDRRLTIGVTDVPPDSE